MCVCGPPDSLHSRAHNKNFFVFFHPKPHAHDFIVIVFFSNASQKKRVEMIIITARGLRERGAEKTEEMS